MRSLTRHKQKDIPLGLVYSGSATTSVTQPLPSSNVPFIRRKQPNLNGGPQLSPQRSVARPTPRVSANLVDVVSYRNFQIKDIANNFNLKSSRENIAKVYAAANTLGVKYRPVAATNLFAYNTVSVSARRIPVRAANDAAIHPAKNGNVVPIRVGGPSVLSLMFGKSPLAGTGLVLRSKVAPSPVVGDPRMAA